MKNYSQGTYLASFGGHDPVYLFKISGGTASAEAMDQKIGAGGPLMVMKGASTFKYDALKLDMGMGISGPMIDWMTAYLNGEDLRKDVQISACDYSGKEMAIREYVGCQITELALPALDAKSKDAAKLSISLQPELAPKHSKGSGKVMTGKFAATQKRITTANWRAEFGALPSGGITKIDALKCETKGAWDFVGEKRHAYFIPTSRSVGNLKLTINSNSLSEWEAAHQRFVIDGECAEGDEIDGQIIFLAQNMKDELFTVELKNCGILKLEHGALEAGKDEVSTFTVDLYVNQLKLIKGKVEG